MLAMLGMHFFEIQKNGYKTLTESLKFSYAEHQKALGFNGTEAIGQYTHSFNMEGTLILQNVSSLELLKYQAKAKVPLLLVFGSGMCYWVTIREIDIDYTRFLTNGSSLKREFKIQLERYYFDTGILGKILNYIG